MPETPTNGFMQCEDCSHHFQISPRGEVQVGACPDCGGKRLFRMQPNPVQSEGTLRNMVDMETGKDAGGNPDGEGILAPPSGRAILTAFAGTLCPHCNADLMGSDVCPHCGLASGIPSELRPEIAGAPLTEGGIMQTEHTDPLDTGAHGRDEYAHSHVIAAVVESGQWEDLPGGEQQYRKNDPGDNLRCPQCHEQIVPDRQAEAAFCPTCDKEWPIYRDEPHSEHERIVPDALTFTQQMIGPPRPDEQTTLHPVTQEPRFKGIILPERGTGFGPVHQGRTGNEMEGVMFADTPAQQNNMRWTPGMIGGEPHTWNRRDPNDANAPDIAHTEYVKSLGVHPQHVDWHNAIDIHPNGTIPNEFGKKDPTPFIAADPRLKLVEEKTPPGQTMANHSRTNNMEPYETLWTAEPEMQLEPREAGLWGDIGAVALPAAAFVGGEAVDPAGGGVIADAALEGAEGAGAAADAAGGADAAANATKATGGLMQKAMSGGKGIAQAEGITGLVNQGVGAGEKALGLGGGGGGEAGGGGAGYSSPLQQFTHVLAAFVESDYETPSSVPDVGVKHDDPEDVDQKEFNDQDKSPENPMNPNLQDSGASGEDQVRDDAGKPSQGQFSPESPAIQRMDMLMPLIEKYYHSDESGANDPMLKQLHEELEAEVPGYLGQGDPEIAERLMQHRKQHPEHVHAAADPMAVREETGDPIPCPYCAGRNPSCEHCGGFGQIPERRSILRPDEQARITEIMRGPDRRQEPRDTPDRRENVQCPACQRGEIVGPACNHCGTTVADILAKPTSREGQVKESIMPPMQQGNLQAQQQALDPTALNPSQMPSSMMPPGGGQQEGHCKNCGGVTQANGACPQCGASNQVGEPAQGVAGGPSVAPNAQTFAHLDLLSSFVEGANHQGPVTPEQVAAVQQYLIQQGRVDEVPNVPLDPGNPEYVKILAEIQQKPETVPTVTPEEQTQPPPPQPAAPGGMPVPGMAPGEAGGQPMQPMSSWLPELDFTEHIAADNIAPSCPNCGGGTTGLVGDEDKHARCHSCKHIWKLPNLLDDNNAAGSTSIARTALRDERQHGGQGEQANPVGVPAADQAQQMNQGGDEDSSLTWQDTAGAPLKAGQTYQMINPSYSLPDLVRVERVKPDGLDVTLLGTFANDPSQHDPNSLTSSTPISKEDADLQQLSFEPVQQTADDRNNEPPPGSAAPGNAQVPPSGQTTDEQAASEPQMATHSRVEHDPDCPRCGHMEYTSSMISAEATEHNCFRCGHDWVTEEEGMEHQAGVDLSYLMEDEDAEDFLSPRRADMARQAGGQSRSLSDIAGKDERLRAVREHLTRNGAERQQRLAGKHFTPREQRELIDEDGIARNSDLLELEGTHYTGRYDESGKANGENVRDADLFLGI